MQQYNFPTIIYSGCNSLERLAKTLKKKAHAKILVVTDNVLKDIGLLAKLTDLLDDMDISYSVFSDTHPNPTEEDVEAGTRIFKENKCDSIVAFGGGSPIDAAKTIKIMATNTGPLAQYDDAKNGGKLITEPMPPLYAVPTTAGTGSEVGRASVIIMRDTEKKTIFFHPKLMPDVAVLEPLLLTGLPRDITAATGLDAFTHSIEAYFSPGLHPMADGIALEGMKQVVGWLETACKEGENLEARERMLIAASMGATAFQKGLGMVHSMAHPLSSRHKTHHGLANALLLPSCLRFLENSELNDDQKKRMATVNSIFKEQHADRETLSENCESYIKNLGIKFGLRHYNVKEGDLTILSQDAYEDSCHQTNMIPVSQDDLLKVFKAAF